jgi:diacylglycerol O-acyltransferase / wax synthase
MTDRATRMAGADAVWLHLDRPRNRMIVNTLLWTTRPIDGDALVERLEHLVIPGVDRLRTRAVEPAITYGLWGGARWQPVTTTVGHHVVRTRLSPPGDDEALRAYVGDAASGPLPAARPLWQLHLIDGYGPGSAVLLRTHHAMADGAAIMRLVDLLADPDGSPPPSLPMAGAAGITRFDPGPWTDPGVLTKLASGIPALSGPLVVPLCGTKSAGWTAAVPLTALRRIAAGPGATLNDVGLAAVAGALGRHLGVSARTGHPATGVQAVVPVNLRGPGEPVTAALGNRFGLVFVALPTGEPDAGERVRRVKVEMDRIKATGEAQVVHDAFVVLANTPRATARSWADAFARRASVVVTNIRGPAHEVSLGGAPVAGIVLLVPSTGPLGVGISICTYSGHARLGLICDDAAVPDSGGLRAELDAGLRGLAPERSGDGGAGVRGESAEHLTDTLP